MRIAVIDDERPARSELSYLINKLRPNGEIIEISNGEDALNIISREKFDLLCIDINLGDISGTTLASTARKIMPDVEIVFATAYNHYAVDAFNVEALDYLLKPFSEGKVKLMLDRYDKKHENIIEERTDKEITRIPLNIDRKIVLVDINSIVYIEAQNKNSIIYTKDKEYIDNTALKIFEDRLSSKGFFRIQRSYIVNTKYIVEIYPWFNNTNCVRMKYFEDEVLSVSRNKIVELRELFKI